MPISTIDNFGIINRDKDYTKSKSITSADWTKSAVIYEVYVRSFTKDGTIKALTKKLPELKDLGVDIIWLMPIHTIGLVKRKGPLGSPYAVRDHYRINPNYGKKESLSELIDKIHELDMKIVLDLVVNHSAIDHLATKEHPEWYQKDEKGKFTRKVQGWSDVIDFNYDNQDLRQYIKDITLYWVKEFDIDGYRCDVAGLVPEDFWIDARKALKEIKPDIFFIAEWEDPEMHLTSFDVTYDWTLYYKLCSIYNKEAPAQEAIKLVLEQQQKFPQHSQRLRFLENHDLARTSYKFGTSSFKPYATLIFTLSGIPLIFNGQEVADNKYLSLFDKNPINWKIKGASNIRMFYKSIIKIRKESAAIKHGETISVENDHPQQVASFIRKTDQDSALIVLNLSDVDCTVNLKLDTEISYNKAFNISNLLTEQVEITNSDIHLLPYNGYIFQ